MGDRWPLAAEPTAEGKASDFPAPDVLIHVVDATTLEADLELTLELSLLVDRWSACPSTTSTKRAKRVFSSTYPRSASGSGFPSSQPLPTWAKGYQRFLPQCSKLSGENACPVPQARAKHIDESLKPLKAVISHPDIEKRFSCSSRPAAGTTR